MAGLIGDADSCTCNVNFIFNLHFEVLESGDQDTVQDQPFCNSNWGRLAGITNLSPQIIVSSKKLIWRRNHEVPFWRGNGMVKSGPGGQYGSQLPTANLCESAVRIVRACTNSTSSILASSYGDSFEPKRDGWSLPRRWRSKVKKFGCIPRQRKVISTTVQNRTRKKQTRRKKARGRW